MSQNVRFILYSNNVQLMSWGVGRIITAGERIQFPTLLRKFSIESVAYKRKRKRTVGTERKKVWSSFFCAIVRKLTRGDVK